MSVVTPTPDKRRAEIDRLRVKACVAVDALNDALDKDLHDNDCVLRCLELDCEQMHSCTICREDGEV